MNDFNFTEPHPKTCPPCRGDCSQGRECPNLGPMTSSDALWMFLAVFGPWALIGAVVAGVLWLVRP